MTIPLPDLIVAAVLLAILGLILRRLFSGKKKNYVQCPGCRSFFNPAAAIVPIASRSWLSTDSIIIPSPAAPGF